MMDITIPLTPIYVGYPDSEFLTCVQKGAYSIDTYKDGTVIYDFDKTRALAYLIAKEYVYCNSRWCFDTDRQYCNIWMDVSDVFAWGMSDGEDLPAEHIQTLYDLVKIHPTGVYIMAMLLRRQMPQSPVWKRLIDSGVWNLKKFIYDYQFKPNGYDSTCAQYFHRKINEDIYLTNPLTMTSLTETPY